MYLKDLLLFALILISAGDARILVKNFAKDVFSVNLELEQFSNHALLRRKRDEPSLQEMDSSSNQYYFELGWKLNKLRLLTSFIEQLSSMGNITLIGWENIHDTDGAIKEVNTIQFVVPPKPGTEGKKGDDDEEDANYERMVPHALVNKIRDITTKFSASYGIHAAGVHELYDKNGEAQLHLYVDKDIMISNSNNFTIYNKTSIATQVEVDEFIKQIDSYSLKSKSILKYDINGKLTKDSSISPHLLGFVTDSYEATDDILINSPAIVAELWAGHSRQEVPKLLASSFNKKWPAWDWRVLVNPSYHYVSRDVSITLSIDSLNFDETSDVKYMVYGRKRTDQSQ